MMVKITLKLSVCLCAASIIAAAACGDDSSATSGPSVRTASLGSPTLHRQLAQGDFDGDGESDWAFGVSAEEHDCGAGHVEVWYRRLERLRPHEIWHRDLSGVAGEQTCSANYGSAVAIGDFNGDGYDDLAVGASGDTIGSQLRAGSIHVFYGSARGLTTNANKMFSQEDQGMVDLAESGDAFGTALASGDFDCDGYADLAVAAPGEDDNRGVLHILPGSHRGLSSGQAQRIEHPRPLPGAYFGSFLAAGNINADDIDDRECDDLVVGIPGDAVPDAIHPTGAISIIYGGDGGLDVEGSELWRGDGSRARLAADVQSEEFGRGVWLVDHNVDGYPDVLVYRGSDETFSLLYGSPDGLASEAARSRRPNEAIKGKLRDACVWACQFAWVVAPPGPVCDCSGCEIFAGKPSRTCPNCA